MADGKVANRIEVLSGWERAFLAAEKVKERLQRSTAALEQAGVAYAVVGGNAVAEWVGRIDEDAVRNTRDVDILIRREDLAAAQAALEPRGVRLLPEFWRRYVPRWAERQTHTGGQVAVFRAAVPTG